MFPYNRHKGAEEIIIQKDYSKAPAKRQKSGTLCASVPLL